MKQIIEVLQEKWKNIQKKYKNLSLFICPLEDLWIPNEITFFSADENSKAFDIGDIFTGYGCPSTNTLFMQYQWNESPIHKTLQKNIADTNNYYINMIKGNLYFDSKDCKKKINFNQTNADNSDNNNFCSNNNDTHRPHSDQTQKINENDNDILAASIFLNNSKNHPNIISNSLLAQPTVYEGSPKDSLNNSQVKVEDFLNSVNESEDEKEKSFVPLEQEYDEFDPLEFLGIYNLNLNNLAENANSSDGDLDEFHFILDDNYDCVWRENNGKNSQKVKSSEHNINVSKKVSAFESPKKIADSDNFICDDSDPYKGIDYFDKIRKDKNSHQESNTGNYLMKAFTVSECHSNLSNNNNQLNNTNFNNNNKSNLNHNQNDSQNTENFNKILNFNDLNSKIKSNSLTLNSLTNLNEGKKEKMNTKDLFQTTSNISYSKEKLIQNNSIDNKISTPNKNLKKHSPSTPKRMTRRIPFINNQKNSEEQSNTNNNFLTNLHNTGMSQNNIIASIESNKDNNLNVFSFPQNEYNTQLTSILKNINSSVNKEKFQIEKKEEIQFFNGENSNLLNYSNNNIGLFDHESNMNILRNPYNNNSMFFNDNMFYSNNLNSMFNRNNDDSMMKVINSSYFRDTRGVENKLKENITCNDNKNETSIQNDEVFNKPMNNEKISSNLNKKTKRKKSSGNSGYKDEFTDAKVKKRKRTEPINLEDILEDSERTSKTTEYKSESIKKKKKEKESAKQDESGCILNNVNNMQNHIPIPLNTQNINISNTNPYIINQNNYFNAYNSGISAGCPPMGEMNNKPRLLMNHGNMIPPVNNSNCTNIDIPHPNKFFNPNYNVNNINYPQMHPIQGMHSPFVDPHCLMNYMRMPGLYYFAGVPRENGNFENPNFKNSK